MCVFTNALAWVWELWYLECCSLFPSCRAGNQTQVNRHRGKHINPLLIRLGVRSKKHYSEWNLQSDRLIHLIHTTSSSSVLQSASFLQLRIDPLLTWLVSGWPRCSWTPLPPDMASGTWKMLHEFLELRLKGCMVETSSTPAFLGFVEIFKRLNNAMAGRTVIIHLFLMVLGQAPLNWVPGELQLISFPLELSIVLVLFATHSETN